MLRWIMAGVALMIACLATPAFAQLQGSEGEKFLEAVKSRDNATAVPMVEEPGSRLVNYRGYDGDTALHLATRNRDLSWINFLLSKGAEPDIGDKNGDTALIIAARIGFEDAADYLIRYRANVDATNRRGETALIVAVQQRQPRLVEALLKAGASPDKADHAAGYTARDYAKRDNRNPQLLKLIDTVKSTKKKVAGPSVN
jgi:ankyrin repeat protein